MDVLHFWFGIFGNVTALFLFLAPMITFKRIIKSRSTEDFSGVPYVATLLNCLLSAWYGLPFVRPHNMLVSTIDGTGTAIELVYVVLFLVFASNHKARVKVGGLLVVFAAVVLVSLLALHGQSRKIFLWVFLYHILHMHVRVTVIYHGASIGYFLLWLSSRVSSLSIKNTLQLFLSFSLFAFYFFIKAAFVTGI